MASHQPKCQAVLDKYFDGYATLQLMSQGSISLHHDDEAYELSGAWAWPHQPGPRVRLRAARQHETWEHRHIAFRGPVVEAWIDSQLWPQKPQPVKDVAAFIALFDEFRRRLYEPGTWQQAALANISERILLLLAAEREQQHAPPWLNTITNRLAAGRVQDFDAVALAASVNMGVSSLRRRFHAATGQSLRDWAMSTRLHKAAQLLQNSQQAIADIAAELGYCDNAAFSKQFKRYFGATPHSYRRLGI